MIIDFTDEEIKDMAEGDAGGLGYHLGEKEFEGSHEQMDLISFPKYYRQQFRDLKDVWHMAKSCKRYWAFIATLFDLLNPFVIHTMWLYDTRRMVIDLRFYPNKDIEL